MDQVLVTWYPVSAEWTPNPPSFKASGIWLRNLFLFLFLKKIQLLGRYHSGKWDIYSFITTPAMSLRHSGSFPFSGAWSVSCSRDKPWVTQCTYFQMPRWPFLCTPILCFQLCLISLNRASLDGLNLVVIFYGGQRTQWGDSSGLINLYVLFPLKYCSALPTYPCLLLSVASATWGQLCSEILKWKIPEINNVWFKVMDFVSGMRKWHSALLQQTSDHVDQHSHGVHDSHLLTTIFVLI